MNDGSLLFFALSILAHCKVCGGDEKQLLWRNLELIFPHKEADLAYKSIPADVLLEATLESTSSIKLQSFLPRDVLKHEALGRFFITLNIDNEYEEHIEIGNNVSDPTKSFDESNNELVVDADDRCAANLAVSVSYLRRRRELDSARLEAYAAFQAAEHDGGAAPRLFARWARLADELADLDADADSGRTHQAECGSAQSEGARGPARRKEVYHLSIFIDCFSIFFARGCACWCTARMYHIYIYVYISSFIFFLRAGVRAGAQRP